MSERKGRAIINEKKNHLISSTITCKFLNNWNGSISKKFQSLFLSASCWIELHKEHQITFRVIQRVVNCNWENRMIMCIDSWASQQLKNSFIHIDSNDYYSLYQLSFNEGINRVKIITNIPIRRLQYVKDHQTSSGACNWWNREMNRLRWKPQW